MPGPMPKYRCIYYVTHDCPNWVWVYLRCCADCAVRILSQVGVL